MLFLDILLHSLTHSSHLVVENATYVFAESGDLDNLGATHFELGSHRVEPGHVLAHLGAHLFGFRAHAQHRNASLKRLIKDLQAVLSV